MPTPQVLLSTSSVYPEASTSAFELSASLGFDGIEWNFTYAMENFHGYRPILAALAYTNMGVTGLACIYRAR